MLYVLPSHTIVSNHGDFHSFTHPQLNIQSLSVTCMSYTDMGFEPQIREILSTMGPKASRQTLFFTATWPKNVQKLAAEFVCNPAQLHLGSADSLQVKSAFFWLYFYSIFFIHSRRRRVCHRKITGSVFPPVKSQKILAEGVGCSMETGVFTDLLRSSSKCQWCMNVTSVRTYLNTMDLVTSL